MELIIVILCFWLGWKLLKWWITRKIRRDSQKIYEQFTGHRASGSHQREPKPRKDGWEHARTTKKYKRDEGEYVAFEEVKVTVSEKQESQTDNPQQQTTTTVDRQIVDAEWEEI